MHDDPQDSTTDSRLLERDRVIQDLTVLLEHERTCTGGQVLHTVRQDSHCFAQVQRRQSLLGRLLLLLLLLLHLFASWEDGDRPPGAAHASRRRDG